jgi:hypothetical protein
MDVGAPKFKIVDTYVGSLVRCQGLQRPTTHLDLLIRHVYETKIYPVSGVLRNLGLVRVNKLPVLKEETTYLSTPCFLPEYYYPEPHRSQSYLQGRSKACSAVPYRSVPHLPCLRKSTVERIRE